MKKKKILFFHFDMKGGGAEKVLVNLVNNLDKEKYDITVQTIFGVGTHIKNLSPHIKYKYTFKKQFNGFTKLQRFFPPKILHRFFIKEQYDLEIAYLETSPTRIISGCPYPDTKLMSWLHITLDSFPWFKNQNEMKNVYSKFDRIVSVSKDVETSFISASGLKDLPFCIQRNVIDSDYIKSQAKVPVNLNIDSSYLKLCYIGRLVPHKDPLRLLHALENIYLNGFNKWHLFFLGTGELEKEIQEFATTHNLSSNITMLGYQTNPYKYINKMDLYVCPSHSEGYSTAATEALILGVPVFTTNCGGMNEILDGGEYGVIVPDEDNLFEEGLKELLLNPPKLEYFKEKAIERGSFFETEQIVAENEALFDSVLNS